MNSIQINSYGELKKNLEGAGRAYLLMYKDGSEQSMCALKNLQDTQTGEGDFVVMTANVAVVRDIHEHYGITSVPSMLEFEKAVEL